VAGFHRRNHLGRLKQREPDQTNLLSAAHYLRVHVVQVSALLLDQLEDPRTIYHQLLKEQVLDDPLLNFTSNLPHSPLVNLPDNLHHLQ
jgi:hypothetical protein